MSIKVTIITEEQFTNIRLSSEWELFDIPQENWNNIPGIQRLHDTVAIMGSATYNQPLTMHGKEYIFAGFDVLANEKNPKQNEPEGNAYHYIIQQTSDPEYPYTMYGPYKDGMRVEHWFTVVDIDTYDENKNAEVD